MNLDDAGHAGAGYRLTWVMVLTVLLGGAGLATAEIFEATRSGKMDLLYLVGEDLWPGSYDAGFVVVQDMFLPAQAGEIADVVFPATSFAEMGSRGLTFFSCRA